jgi:hypothetical protein
MAFHYTPQLREEYYSVGITVLRDLIPAPLLTALRQETDKAREIARQQRGPQVQRLQPVYAYDALNHEPFHEFSALPGLQETCAKILGDGYQICGNQGILLEPEAKAWCTNWHRDWGHHVEGLDLDIFHKAVLNPRMFNQINGALYDDHSLWVVPGSHDRPHTPEELAAFGSVPAPPPKLTDAMSPVERELACTEYVRRMPGATNIVLSAGDVAFYRACGWHIGTYVSYVRRATLHDGFYCDDDYAWQAQMKAIRESKENRL